MQNQPSQFEVNELLEPVRRRLGFVPNVLKEMSVNPAVLHVYLEGQEALARGRLTPKEQQAVQLMVSVFNDCQYCQAAHRWLSRQVGLADEDIDAISNGTLLTAEPALGHVVRATKLVLDNKGWLDQEALRELEQDGIDCAKLYEIIAWIGLKTISNYINHVAHTEIDEAFRSERPDAS